LKTENKKRVYAIFLIVASMSLPFLTMFALTAYAKFFPHVIRFMQGKYIISISFLLSIPLVFFTTQKCIKSSVVKIFIRLPMIVIFVLLAFLFTIMSYCDPYWFGEKYDDSTFAVKDTNGNGTSNSTEKADCK